VSGSSNYVYNPLVAMSGVPGSIGSYTLNVSYLGGGADANGVLASATPITVGDEINAEIGDEVAGARDVDIYSFHVNAGDRVSFETLAYSLGSSLDTILRLFDGAGTQLAFNDDTPFVFTLDSYIEYTFSSAGTYYIGVSGYPNSNYNPLVPLSGQLGSTGEYTLRVTMLGPDLAITSVLYTGQTTVVPGGRKTGILKTPRVIVANNGSDIARGRMTVNLYASTTPVLGAGEELLLATRTTSVNLAPGLSTSFNWGKIWMPNFTAGDFYLIAQIQPNDAVHDVNLNNHVSRADSTVLCLTPDRDLAPAVTIVSRSTIVIPGDRRSGFISGVIVNIANSGSSETYGTVRIDLYISDDTGLDAGDSLFASLDAKIFLRGGGTKAVKLKKLAAPALAPGLYYLIAQIQPDDNIRETRTDNNTASSTQTLEWQ